MSEPRRRSSGRWKKHRVNLGMFFFFVVQILMLEKMHHWMYIWIHVLFKRMKGKYEHLPDASKLKHIITLHNYFWALRCPKKNMFPFCFQPQGSPLRFRRKVATELGISIFNVTCPESVSEGELLTEVAELNADPKVHGILVQLLGRVNFPGEMMTRWKLVVVYIIPNSIGVKIGPQYVGNFPSTKGG